MNISDPGADDKFREAATSFLAPALNSHDIGLKVRSVSAERIPSSPSWSLKVSRRRHLSRRAWIGWTENGTPSPAPFHPLRPGRMGSKALETRVISG